MIRKITCTLAALCLLGLFSASGLFAQATTATLNPAPTPVMPSTRANQPVVMTFTGTITAVETSASMSSFTLAVDNGDPQKFMSAPAKYLTKIGLTLSEKEQITGTALTYGPVKTAAGNENQKQVMKLPAITIVADGKTYQLRDANGGVKWSYWEIFCEYKTVSGEITKVSVPAAAQTGAPGAPGASAVFAFLTMTVKSSDKTYVFNVAPQSYADKVKFSPAVGAKITMTGWEPAGRNGGIASATTRIADAPNVAPTPPVAVVSSFALQSITMDGVTYQFRDASGKELWQIASTHSGEPRK